MSITSTIVNVNATVTPAPAPSTLQQSGALVSVGGTTLTVGTYQYCSSLSVLTAILSGAGNHTELSNMGTTFFAQGAAVGFYVLELGTQASASAGISALQTWINANPYVFYAYLTPATWDTAAAAFNTMAATYSSAVGITYFCATATTANLTSYLATTKAFIVTVPSPTASGTEFQSAVLFYNLLVNNPTPAAPIPPMDFRFAFGVTPWAQLANSATITTILTAYANVILTGAEGGISNSLIRNGTTMDGNQIIFWYAVDWMIINAKQNLAATIIRGSNSNPPLYYNQPGINALLGVLTQLGATGTNAGLFLSTAFAAVNFTTYIQQYPGNYTDGIYNGLSATVTPQAGFESITFNLDAVQF